MNYWLDTVETIPEGVGFTGFSTSHLLWLFFGALFILCSALLYRTLAPKKRKIMRFLFAGLIVADELFKMIVLFTGGRYLASYLPLHLCSINIFVISYHVFRPNKTIDNFLYTVCIPGALAALLFPSWTRLPMANCMTIHSFTVHILLMAYPIMLLSGGDIKPELRLLPKSLLLLVGFGLVALIANLLLDTNFMFLMHADPGNPLYFFEQLFGSHLIGFPVLISAILLVMYAPIIVKTRKRKS